METPDLFRRNTLKLAISSVCLMALPACVSNPEKRTPGPFLVDTTDVNDLNGLIQAIKKAAGSALPSSLTMEDFYKSIAQTFVENARKAADIGMQIPDWVLNKLPGKKTTTAKDEVKPETVAMVIMGVMFLIPWTRFFIVIFASILTLTRYITDKLNERRT